MICDVCGKQGARVRRVARTYGKGKDILVIENVPIVTCPHCGESYKVILKQRHCMKLSALSYTKRVLLLSAQFL